MNTFFVVILFFFVVFFADAAIPVPEMKVTQLHVSLKDVFFPLRTKSMFGYRKSFSSPPRPRAADYDIGFENGDVVSIKGPSGRYLGMYSPLEGTTDKPNALVALSRDYEYVFTVELVDNEPMKIRLILANGEYVSHYCCRATLDVDQHEYFTTTATPDESTILRLTLIDIYAHTYLMQRDTDRIFWRESDPEDMFSTNKVTFITTINNNGPPFTITKVQ